MPDSQPTDIVAPDALIVALARLGDRAAFSELVRRHQSWVRNLMRRLCADPTLAEDLSQQVFLQAMKDIARIRDPKRFQGWLKRLAINLWLKHQRVNDPLERAADLSEPAPVRETPALRMDLDQALATLTPAARTCIVLSMVEGLTHQELATSMDLPLGTVKSHIRRGTEQLRGLLSSYRPSQDTAV